MSDFRDTQLGCGDEPQNIIPTAIAVKEDKNPEGGMQGLSIHLKVRAGPGEKIPDIHITTSASGTSSSRLSTSKPASSNNIIQDVVLGESSVRNARNFVLKAEHIPKPSKILDDLKKNRANSRVNSSTSNVVQRQPGIIPKPVTCGRTASTAEAAEIVIKPEPLTNFGCVAIGEELASNGAVQIQPNCSQEFIVIFIPHECKRYQSFAKFCVSSSGKTYSHALLAYVKNFGDRAAYAYIVAVDTNGTEARNITVQPKSFCLTPTSNNPDDSSKVNITVKVPENYVQSMSQISMDFVRSAKRNNVFSLKVYFGDERLRQ
uniref:Uncharacterized protein n=1 Tax=Panagrolaimus sp. PS1159 TaxID=55785 RepID=A0AC35GK18_9BILA